MHLSTAHLARTLVLAAACASACAAAAAANANPTTASGPLVYAAPTSRGVVDVYPGGPTKPQTPLYSFGLDPGVANSLVVDARGNLFLADSYSTLVLEYAPGATHAMREIQTIQRPFNLALNGRTLYVFQGAGSGGDAGIAVYPHDRKTPSRLLTDPQIVFPQGLAVDATGNVFVGYGGAKLGAFGVGEFVGGRMPMHRLNVGRLFPLALAIDAGGDLVVDASKTNGTSTLYIFPPGATKARTTIANLPPMYQFSFTADGASFYAGDMGRGRAFQLYAYPSGALIYTFKDPNAFNGFAGIAAAPSLAVGVWGKPADN